MLQQNDNVNAWIAERLKACREEKKMSAARLAALIDKPLMSIKNIECGRARVSVELALKYARALGVPLSHILGEEEQSLSPKLMLALGALPKEKADALADAIPRLYPECFRGEQ